MFGPTWDGPAGTCGAFCLCDASQSNQEKRMSYIDSLLCSVYCSLSIVMDLDPIRLFFVRIIRIFISYPSFLQL